MEKLLKVNKVRLLNGSFVLFGEEWDLLVELFPIIDNGVQTGKGVRLKKVEDLPEGADIMPWEIAHEGQRGTD